MRGLLLLIPLLSACGQQAPIGDPGLDIKAGVAEVQQGQAFPLTVVRTWKQGPDEPEWNDGLLEPLVVHLLETSRREADGKVEETRRYRAHAFALSDLSVPVELRVKRLLDPEEPGGAELPALPEPEPFPWWTVGLGAAALVGLLLAARQRKPKAAAAAPAEEPEPAPGPDEVALEQLAALRGRVLQTDDEVQAFYVEASGVVRDYTGARFEVRAQEMTTEQLVAQVSHNELRAVLQHCDLVKFAKGDTDAEKRDEMLDRAETFVRGTAQ